MKNQTELNLNNMHYLKACVKEMYRSSISHARTNARTHARTLARSHTHTHTHACARTHAHTHTHARTHARTHTLTHARTRACMHAYTCSLFSLYLGIIRYCLYLPFRLYPITFATSRFIPEGLELGGYEVPAGVRRFDTLFTNPHTINYSHFHISTIIRKLCCVQLNIVISLSLFTFLFFSPYSLSLSLSISLYISLSLSPYISFHTLV